MTASTLTVTDFILARIAEDEEAARGACEAPWVTMDWPAASQVLVDPKAIRDEKWKYGKLGHVAMAEHSEYATHIARHDPARVLAQCAAMRKIVELHQISTERVWEHSWDGPSVQVEERSCVICGWVPTACDTIRALASVWSDHPAFRDEWRA